MATIFVEIYRVTYKQELVILSFLHFLFLFKFLQTFIIKLVEEKTVSIFLGCLIFYEITAATKYFGLITGFANAVPYYIITTIFEFLIGLFFCLFKEIAQKFLFNLKELRPIPKNIAGLFNTLLALD